MIRSRMYGNVCVQPCMHSLLPVGYCKQLAVDMQRLQVDGRTKPNGAVDVQNGVPAPSNQDAGVTRDHRTSTSCAPPPPDGGWGWAVCFASFYSNAVIFGYINTFGILYVHIIDEFGAGVDDIAFKSCKQSPDTRALSAQLHGKHFYFSTFQCKSLSSPIQGHYSKLNSYLVCFIVGINTTENVAIVANLQERLHTCEYFTGPSHHNGHSDRRL